MERQNKVTMLFLLKTIERLTEQMLIGRLEHLDPQEIEEINYEARYLSSLYRGDDSDA